MTCGFILLLTALRFANAKHPSDLLSAGEREKFMRGD